MDATERERRVAGVAALDQPVRLDLYRLLATGDDGWLSRDAAAEALDLPRSVVAFHLDKLVDAGVAEVRFERTSGRQGPGAGRPSKLYRRSSSEVAASVPERHYDLAGLVLTEAIGDSVATGEPVAACLAATAGRTGRDAGAAADDAQRGLLDALADQGYEPVVDGRDILLDNCPFHRLAEANRTLVCGMNRDYLDGFLEGFGEGDDREARLDPRPGHCCVRIRAT